MDKSPDISKTTRPHSNYKPRWLVKKLYRKRWLKEHIKGKYIFGGALVWEYRLLVGFGGGRVVQHKIPLCTFLNSIPYHQLKAKQTVKKIHNYIPNKRKQLIYFSISSLFSNSGAQQNELRSKIKIYASM